MAQSPLRRGLSAFFNTAAVALNTATKGVSLGIGLLSLVLEFAGAAKAAPLALAAIAGGAALAGGISVLAKNGAKKQIARATGTGGRMALLTPDGKLKPRAVAYAR